MIPAFHAYSFGFDDRIELTRDEKIKLFCSADQWQRHNGPMDLICDEHFFNYIHREGLDELYMNIVPLPECDSLIHVPDTALRTAPIGHVYLGLDVVVEGPVFEYKWRDLYKATGPDIADLSALPVYPKRGLDESVWLLEEVPEWITESLVKSI